LDEDRTAWSSTYQMNVSRSGPGVEAINGRIYVVGGMEYYGQVEASCEVFDPVKKTWEFITPMITPRRNPGLALFFKKLNNSFDSSVHFMGEE